MAIVLNNTKKEQGYPLTTSYAGGNLRDRGYPNNYADNGAGMTGVRNGKVMTSYGGSSGSSGSKSSGGSKSGSYGASLLSSSAANSAADAYNALLAAYKRNDYSDYLNSMRAAAQAAYDRGMKNLNSAYDKQMSTLYDNLEGTKGQLLDNYNRSKDSITADSDESLRQAYINRKLSERNLGQQMSALGLSGGATETTLAGMLNNYGNARNEINTTTNRNLSNLEGNYNNNLAEAIQAYNSAVANAEAQRASQAMNLENALANNQMSALSDYYSLMQSENQNYLDLLKTAIANGASFSYDPTSADNAVKALAYTQAGAPTTNTNYAAIQALMNAQSAPGQSGNALTIANPAVNNNYLNAILKQLVA